MNRRIIVMAGISEWAAGFPGQPQRTFRRATAKPQTIDYTEPVAADLCSPAMSVPTGQPLFPLERGEKPVWRSQSRRRSEDSEKRFIEFQFGVLLNRALMRTGSSDRSVPALIRLTAGKRFQGPSRDREGGESGARLG
jgi:hypothetical protein